MFDKASGINSIIVTNIIAPAVNDKMNGKSILILTTNKAPITAKIGSTIALKQPIRKALYLEIPSLLKGNFVYQYL